MDTIGSGDGHILLVDDESYLLNALADFLSDQGYAVDAVEDPVEALDLLEQKVFDLVVTDYRLPNLSGLELLEKVKDKNPRIEVIVITGYGSKESVLEALRLGAYAFIEKPFDAVELLKSVVNCLETIRLKARIDHLVEDLHDNRRKLERALSGRDQELDDKQDCLERMAQVVDRLDEAVSDISRSSGNIWDDAVVCRKRRQSYLSDVSRLISTCARETRQITSGVSHLEALTREIDAAVRDRLTDKRSDVPEVPDGVDPEETPGRWQSEPQADRPDTAEAVLPTQADVEGLYAEMQQTVMDVLESIDRGHSVDIEPARRLIDRIFTQDGALDALYRLAIGSGAYQDEWDLQAAVVVHSANVAVYALKLGEGLDYAADRLRDLGVAALVHDVGMASLPQEIHSKEALDESDREALRNHPYRGHELLSHLDEKDAWLAEVALQEHEREDGSGYPNGLKGDQICEEAKIIGLVDNYAGLARSRPGRRGLPPFEVVKEITQTHRKKFHSRILRALLRKLSAFPIGSLVRLNSGTVGRVTETDEAYPLRPVILPLYDGENRPIDGAGPVSLRENPILHISGVVYQEDLKPKRSRR